MNKKPFLGIGISLLFILLGINLITRAQEQTESDDFGYFVGIACVVFFGGMLLLGVYKMVKR